MTINEAMTFFLIKQIATHSLTHSLHVSQQTDQWSDEQRRNYHISVVEREVLAGLLEVPETKGTCLVLARSVRNVNMNDNKGGKFGADRAIHD